MTMKSHARNKRLTRAIITVLALLTGLPLASSDEPVPDFALLDVNPTSSTYDQLVSPRDFLHRASGWYFGHAT